MTQTNFGEKSTAFEVVKGLNVKLNGKLVLITGATSGIGVETARVLASTDAHVIITARDMNRGRQVVEDINKCTSNNKIEVMELDLTSLSSVRTFVTIDGFESQFAVNHLAHFLLVNSLLPQLKLGKPARVIVVSSVANKLGGINFDDINWDKSYDKWLAYAQSKTANILFAKQLNKLYESQGIKAFALHPGGIITNLQKHMPIEEQKAFGFFKEDGTTNDAFKNVQQGASTTVYAALSPELDNHGGEYLEDCQISRIVNDIKSEYVGRATHTTDMNAAQRLWSISETMVASK